jgi:hypothetical protein
VDLTGRFSLALAPGTYDLLLCFSSDRLAAAEVRVSLAPGDEKAIEVPLCRGGAVAGRVLLAGSGEPVEQAFVFAETLDGTPVWLTGSPSFEETTDEHGAFELNALPEGDIVVVASDPEHPPTRSRPVRIVAGRTQRVAIELRSRQGIHGSVEHLGLPVPAAGVTVRSAGGKTERGTSTGPGGRFEVPELPEGDYEAGVEARLAGGRSVRATRPVTVEAGKSTEVFVSLDAVLLRGRVLRSVGKSPVADASVAVRFPTFGHEALAATDRSGRFALELIPLELVSRASYEVEIVDPEGGAVHRFEVAAPEGAGEVSREFEIGPTGKDRP